MKRITFELRHGDRPWTVNAERNLHPMQRHVLVKRWRTAFRELAEEAHAPANLTNVHVHVTPFLENRRGLQDVGAAFPAAKAAIDGLVDARVMEDDNPSILTFLSFSPPVIGQGNGLLLAVTGDLEEPDPAPKVRQPRKRPTARHAKKTAKTKDIPPN